MAIKDWYKMTFQIESDSEEIIIWKLNELGIFSFSFEYLIKNDKTQFRTLVVLIVLKTGGVFLLFFKKG